MNTKDITKTAEQFFKEKKGYSPMARGDKIKCEFAEAYHQSQSKQITDNSKVNTNLLKENEALKQRIDELSNLLKEVRNNYLFGVDFETGEPRADMKALMEIWEKVNTALNNKLH